MLKYIEPKSNIADKGGHFGKLNLVTLGENSAIHKNN